MSEMPERVYCTATVGLADNQLRAYRTQWRSTSHGRPSRYRTEYVLADLHDALKHRLEVCEAALKECREFVAKETESPMCGPYWRDLLATIDKALAETPRRALKRRR